MNCRECDGTGFRDEKKPENGVCPCCGGSGIDNEDWDNDLDPYNNGGIPWDNGASIFDPPTPSGGNADEF